RRLAARVFSQHLDRGKPLWELWVVEGLKSGRWALLSKVHHCMVDGVAATDLMSVMFSDTTGASAADRYSPAPEPSEAEVLVRTIARQASIGGALETLRTALRTPEQSLRALAQVLGGLAAAAGTMRPAQPSSLTGQIGPHRRWSWADAALTDVKRIRRAFGGTVNDVVLTAITNGFRELLLARGEEPGAEEVVRTMVPVSVRHQNERGTYNNRASAVFASLPVGLSDPVERLQSIRAEMDGIKESKQAVAGDVLASLSGFAPPLLLALGSRLVTVSPRLNM